MASRSRLLSLTALFGALALARGHASWLDGVYSWEAPELRPANYDPVSHSRGNNFIFIYIFLRPTVSGWRQVRLPAHSDSDAQTQGGRGWSASMMLVVG